MLPKVNSRFNYCRPASRPRRKGPETVRDTSLYPNSWRTGFWVSSPPPRFLGDPSISYRPYFTLSPGADTSYLHLQTQRHLRVADRERQRPLRHHVRDPLRVRGGARAGPRGGAWSAGGGVTCRPLRGGGRGRGAAEEGGLLGDLVLCEQLRAGQVHVPAGRKPSPGWRGGPGRQRNPARRGDGRMAAGLGRGAAGAPPRGRAASVAR